MKGHSERNNSGKPEENFENLEVNRAILLYSGIYNFQLNEPSIIYGMVSMTKHWECI